jgi:hypothetical protein
MDDPQIDGAGDYINDEQVLNQLLSRLNLVDLVIRCEAICERHVCAAAIIDPAAVLRLAKAWRPQVDILAKEFWQQLTARREEIINGLAPIDDVLNDVLNDVLDNVDFWLLYGYATPGKLAIEEAQENLDRAFYLKATRIGLPLVLKLVAAEVKNCRKI